MCLVGALPWFRGVLLFIVQIIGGIAAAGLVSCMFPGTLNVQTTLGGNTSITQGLFIEMMLTAQLGKFHPSRLKQMRLWQHH